MQSYKSYIENDNHELVEKEIFKLDDFGNLWLMGNLTLGENGTLTAAYIDSPERNDFGIIRDAAEMEPPFSHDTSVVLYLGESVEEGAEYEVDSETYTYTQDYTYGTWYKKYVYGYDCVIDTASISDINFAAPTGDSFRIIHEGLYEHNTDVIDTYPLTTKIVLSAIPSSGAEGDTGHWEVKYYDSDNELLFNDTLSSHLLDHSNYHFPITPLNANDYSEETDIVISVTKVYGLKEIYPVDWSLYMPIAGGTFTGIIKTQNIIPDLENVDEETGFNIYSIGTLENRYYAGYFKDLVAKTIEAEELKLEALNIDSLQLAEGKTDIEPGDALVIADNADNGNLKRAHAIQFNNDTSTFLRRDGQFAIPRMNVPEVESLDDLDKIPGVMVSYTGPSTPVFIHNVMYISIDSATSYQILIEGATFNGNVFNAGIIDKTSINSESRLINAINALGIGDVADFIENDGSITLVYSSGVQGWYIDTMLERGVVSSALTLGAASNTDLLNELITDNTLFEVTNTDGAEVKVTISKFLWKPINVLQFDGRTTNKFLSLAGTWESVNSSSSSTSEEGFTPRPAYSGHTSGQDSTPETGDVLTGEYKYVIGNASISNANYELSVEGLDAIYTPGVYSITDTNYNTSFIAIIRFSGSGPSGQSFANARVYQTLYKVFDNSTQEPNKTIPDKLYRVGNFNSAGTSITWKNWIRVYNKTDLKTSFDIKGTWRTLTSSEFGYLLNTRTNAATLKAFGTVAGVPGLIILNDEGTLPSISSAHFSTDDPSDYSMNVYSEAEWNKYYSNYMIFLPVTGKRTIRSVSGIKTDTGNEEGNYWTASHSTASAGKALCFEVPSQEGDDFVSIENKSKASGYAVRLVKNDSNGKFSVSSERKVTFAPGNLQYHPLNNLFRFAKNEFDTIDEFNVNIASDYDGWIDLFGYGTSGDSGTSVTEYSGNDNDYPSGSIVNDDSLDWGNVNPIYTIHKPSAINCLEEDY